MEKLSFLNPEFFWLFLLIPIAGVWLYWKRNQQTANLKISSTKGFKDSNSLLIKLKPMLNVMNIDVKLLDNCNGKTKDSRC